MIRFNPRPRAGGDSLFLLSMKKMISFNPRPRAGGDRLLRYAVPSFSGFNPRPRAGGDLRRSVMACMLWVSIHAPARGATKR